jgi:hypothetical protein
MARSNNDPERAATFGVNVSDAPAKPITNTDRDDVKQQSEGHSTKHNSDEEDKGKYQFIEESDCGGGEDSSSEGLPDDWEDLMEPFTFATSTQLDFPVHVKMYVYPLRYIIIPLSQSCGQGVGFHSY